MRRQRIDVPHHVLAKAGLQVVGDGTRVKVGETARRDVALPRVIPEIHKAPIEGVRKVVMVRDADRMSVAQIEKSIADFGRRAKEGTLTLDDMKGGTFTISNGGVFGSLMCGR